MENLFSGYSRFAADLGRDGLKERRFYLIISVLAFIPAAFILWEIHYELWTIIGSFASHSPDQAAVHVRRMIPLYVTGLALIFFLIYTNGAYRAGSEHGRITKWRVGGIVMIILGAVTSLYVIIGLLTGEYARIVEGYLTPLFPLDFLLAGLLFAAMGFLSTHYSKVISRKGTELPYVNDSGLFGLRMCTFGLFRLLSLLVSLCAFAGSIWAFVVLDLAHGYLIYSIVLWLNFLTAFAMYVVYRYVFCELRAEKRPAASFRLGCIFLVINIVLFALHLLTVQIWNEAPDITAFGLLPADFLASKNLFALYFGLNNILAPLIAVIRGKFMKNRK